MRALLSILYILISFSVLSQTKESPIIDTPILFNTKKNAHNEVQEKSISLPKRDSIPSTSIKETIYQGRKVRIVTEYMKP
jgi:hypothetical protein